MRDDNSHLLAILRIAHETSMWGAGPSMCEALRRTQYRRCRASFGPAELRSLLSADPALTEEWFAYSEDKRTNGGWYLLRSGEVGRLGDPELRKHFESLEEAVAQYVVQELDFWAGLEDAS